MLTESGQVQGFAGAGLEGRPYTFIYCWCA
jgi:hypothetical protein